MAAAARVRRHAPAVLSGLVLALTLALAYGPAKLEGHIIYTGVIQDVTNLYGFFCWDLFSAGELAAGRVPLWNPYNAFGVPHLANMQSALFYPLNWLKFILGFWQVIDWLLMLRMWLAGMFAWLFVRRAFRVGTLPALVSGVSYMLCGYLTRYVYMSHLNVEILIPLQLLLMHLVAEKRSVARMAAAGAGFALLVLGGFPEASLWAITLALGYYLAAAGAGSRDIVAALISLSIGLVLSSLQWLPFAEYYVHAWTYHDPSAGGRALDPALSISLVLPWFFGENRLSPAVPFLAPYLGAAPVFLALCALPGIRRRGRPGLFFAAGCVILAGVIYGVPPFSLIGRLFPYSLTYNDKYAAPALAFCLAALAGSGAERLSRRGAGRTAVAACGLMLLWMGAYVVLGLPAFHAFKPIYALGLLKPALIAAGAGLVVAPAVLALMRTRGLIPPLALEAGLAAAVLAGALWDLRGHTPEYHDGLPRGMETVERSMEGRKSMTRVYLDPEIERLFPNRLLPSRAYDIRYYDPLYPEDYVSYMALMNGMSGDTVRRHYNSRMIFAMEREAIGGPLARLAGVGVYTFPLPWEERMLTGEWAAKARTVSDRRESWLRDDAVSAGGVEMRSLIEHAPVRITAAVRAGMSEKGSPALRFSAGVPEGQVTEPGEKGDGVSFLALVHGGGGLRFARYLDPKNRPEEDRWVPAEISLPPVGEGKGEISLVLLPGPGNDRVRDAGAFGALRIYDPSESTGLRPIGGEGPPFIYGEPRAYPRFWFVRGYGSKPDGYSYMEALGRIGNTNPDAFIRVVLLENVPDNKPQPPISSADELKLGLQDSVPGMLRLEYSSPVAGALVITEQYLPGWSARLVSGDKRRAARVLRANGPFMAVPVPAGKFEIELLYRPWSFRAGVWSALASLLCTGFFTVRGLVKGLSLMSS